jgi:hypothetical protein
MESDGINGAPSSDCGSFRGDQCFIAPCELSNEQYTLLSRVLVTIRENGVSGQTLILAHGGGGTGKSFVVRRICKEIESMQFQVVPTCPTGAGACQLTGGMTFHSALKYSRGKRRLSSASAAVLRRRFGPRVVLVVVDEISMFQADQLVVLDERLRDIYGSSLPFGGKSVLLVRSFFSLPLRTI